MLWMGKKHLGRAPILDTQLERELCEHVLLLENMLFGVSKETLQQLAYQLAVRNQVPDAKSFNVNKQCAGRKWFTNFLRRNPEVSVRTPEATSIARETGFNQKSVDMFFDLYEPLVDNYALTADRIYNMDETSLSTVQKPGKIIARKGKSQVGSVTSDERGASVTCGSCMSAIGNFPPPMLIYKRKRIPDALKNGAPPGTVFEAQDSGWVDREIFVRWLQHFINNVKTSKAKPVLLVLDGNSSHTGNVHAIDLARDNGVMLLSLPTHTTHRLHPLDVSYFKPFNTYFDQAWDTWLRSNPV